MKKDKLLALFCGLCMIPLSACSDTDDTYDYDDAEYDNYDISVQSEDLSPADRASGYGFSMQLDENGKLNIIRNDVGSVPMGEDGTWTVFVYLCGTDLESDGGYATYDIEEMLNASTGSNVKFVIQTGGTYIWQNDLVASEGICRYEICDGEMTQADQLPDASMGAADTLADFLSWGIQNYPAAKMGLIFWNHGGGSISGVCFDELNDSDSLSLTEISYALSEASASMTDKFEFIGFDACLMGTVETANILATYSRYMYGSEETEPGYGWDYAAIGNFLGETPSADGAQLGRIVCDSFYEGCEEIYLESGATLSVIDLSKLDDVIISFNDYSKNLYEASEDKSVLSAVVRAVREADNYGGNNKSEGYTNMVDLAGIVNSGAEHADGADKVLSAIDAAVVYSRNGSDHSNACGLSAYYPLQLQGSEELKIFGNVAVSPYYLSFVDRTVYGNTNNGDTDDYDYSSIFDFWFADEDADDYWDSYGDCESTGDSPLIAFYDEPQLMDNGRFGFSLTEESLGYTASVQENVYIFTDDMDTVIELGESPDVIADWENGVFMDSFEGCWFSLPDGQILAVYIVDECDGYDVYTSPIELNGEETNLRLTHDYINNTVTIDGTWDGVCENGMAARHIYKLKQGDKITPMYYVISAESSTDFYYYGQEYVFDGEPEIYFELLEDGNYLYGFIIDDVFGDYFLTDYAIFTIEGDSIIFNGIL